MTAGSDRRIDMEHRTPSLLEARRLHRVRGNSSIGLNVVPLVDVTFLLMIFFVIAGAFEAWEGTLALRLLPTGQGFGVPLPLSPVVVRLTRTGPNEQDVVVGLDRFPQPIAGYSELANQLGELQRRPGFDRQTPIAIVADDEVPWDHVVNAWNAAVRAGYTNLVFGQPTPS
ncbi:MAG: biopolymer transporter ExbD [Planctomycetota bacterium]